MHKQFLLNFTKNFLKCLKRIYIFVNDQFRQKKKQKIQSMTKSNVGTFRKISTFQKKMSGSNSAARVLISAKTFVVRKNLYVELASYYSHLQK